MEKPVYFLMKPYLLAKPLYSMGKLLFLGKTFMSFWLTFYPLTKPLHLLAKPLPLDKTFLLHG
jgi:hypothetical protein